ncbi:MAG: tetratricopeptide repeat protein [Thermodesulfobacteriota bacterium]|nr:tetratricopeptide repeat protein [Thermodesulfobacteriota bacterium]
MSEKDQLTFLLVDSDISRLDRDVEIIHGMGHTSVLQAEDGAEAWAMIKNFNVDFIICGMDVPEVNGLALLKIVRSHEDYASIPFMLVADQITAKLVVRAGKTGVSDIVVWPFTPDKFESKVNDIVISDETPQNQEAEKKYKQGMELMEAGQYDEALKSFESITSVFEHAEVYYNMGYIKSSKGLYEEALKYFHRATQINESYARAYKKMAEVYIKLGKQEEAEKYLEQAADIHIQKKEDNEAEEILQTVAKLHCCTSSLLWVASITYQRSDSS